jgi:hypothetical protein
MCPFAVFIAAGLLQWVDYMATPAVFKAANGCSPKGCITFFQAFYFMIVTVNDQLPPTHYCYQALLYPQQSELPSSSSLLIRYNGNQDNNVLLLGVI